MLALPFCFITHLFFSKHETTKRYMFGIKINQHKMSHIRHSMSAAIRKCPNDITLRNAKSKLDVIVHISKLYITSRHYREIWLFNHKIGQSGPLT